jgi:hypothetical protein
MGHDLIIHCFSAILGLLTENVSHKHPYKAVKNGTASHFYQLCEPPTSKFEIWVIQGVGVRRMWFFTFRVKILSLILSIHLRFFDQPLSPYSMESQPLVQWWIRYTHTSHEIFSLSPLFIYQGWSRSFAFLWSPYNMHARFILLRTLLGKQLWYSNFLSIWAWILDYQLMILI